MTTFGFNDSEDVEEEKEEKPDLQSRVESHNSVVFHFGATEKGKTGEDKVVVTGNWCDWEEEYQMDYWPALKAYCLKLFGDFWKNDKVVYKFKVNGEWTLNEKDIKEESVKGNGIFNNVLSI